jgi:hypothetical protein
MLCARQSKLRLCPCRPLSLDSRLQPKSLFQIRLDGISIIDIGRRGSILRNDRPDSFRKTGQIPTFRYSGFGLVQGALSWNWIHQVNQFKRRRVYGPPRFAFLRSISGLERPTPDLFRLNYAGARNPSAVGRNPRVHKVSGIMSQLHRVPAGASY